MQKKIEPESVILKAILALLIRDQVIPSLKKNSVLNILLDQ